MFNFFETYPIFWIVFLVLPLFKIKLVYQLKKSCTSLNNSIAFFDNKTVLQETELQEFLKQAEISVWPYRILYHS